MQYIYDMLDETWISLKHYKHVHLLDIDIIHKDDADMSSDSVTLIKSKVSLKKKFTFIKLLNFVTLA